MPKILKKEKEKDRLKILSVAFAATLIGVIFLYIEANKHKAEPIVNSNKSKKCKKKKRKK